MKDATLEDLRHADRWKGNHKGVYFEIVKWGTKAFPEHGIGARENWNYYLFFYKNEFTQADWIRLFGHLIPGKYGADYYSSQISDLDWHGGITYGEFITDYEGKKVAFKAGCDYGHLYDEGHIYSLSNVFMDCIWTIDDFIEKNPGAWVGREMEAEVIS